VWNKSKWYIGWYQLRPKIIKEPKWRLW
jgi:hypothetical protein